MDDRIRWGVLGTGRMAANFAEDLARLPDAELLAVGSRSRESADAFGDRYGIPLRFGSCERLADTPEIDVVYVATPHSMHCEQTLLCLNAGKAVLCEKPLAINHAQAVKMAEAAAASKVFLMEAMWTRFTPALERLRGWLQEGVIGEPQLLVAGGAFIPDFDPDFYLFKPELGGGVLLDAGVYLVSMASMIFGQPAEIRALGGKRSNGIDDHEAIILSHAGGALASLFVSLRTRMPPEVTLLGREGRIRLHPPLFCPRKMTLVRAGGDEEQVDCEFEGSGYRFQAEEVHRCLREGRLSSAGMPVQESLQIMRTLDAIRSQLGVRYPME